ncbi:hypothetical protein COR50_06795 [Chitinophaga caeni]|uniref:Uncharacterized protein n=1 Tax=Chitinophaga caeni TaxID=2029983 RepID=A0A291QSQ4_9BACT|nr:hypothetical protein COR50_06795 [Chitinophaga caeni]
MATGVVDFEPVFLLAAAVTLGFTTFLAGALAAGAGLTDFFAVATGFFGEAAFFTVALVAAFLGAGLATVAFFAAVGFLATAFLATGAAFFALAPEVAFFAGVDLAVAFLATGVAFFAAGLALGAGAAFLVVLLATFFFVAMGISFFC